MARLVVDKGIDSVIRAIALLPKDFRLVVAGEGPDHTRLKQLASDLALADRVVFLGWVSGRRRQALLRACDVFCLPSRYDSFGMSFIEAMAMGLPVVALRQGAVPDVVAHDITGVLVDSNDPAEVSLGIQHALARRDILRVQAARRVVSAYSAEAVLASAGAEFSRIWAHRGWDT